MKVFINIAIITLFFAALFFICPFAAFVLAFVLLFQKKSISAKTLILIVVIALFWGLLNFTQKTIGSTETDLVRYYSSMQYAEDANLFELFLYINPLEILNFVFYPVSFSIISLSGRVEMMSFFWAFLVYLLTYIAILRLFWFYECNSQRIYAIVIFITSFIFMLFVEIGDVMKQSTGFALAFYAYTLYLTNGKTWQIAFFNVIAIGCHPTVVLLFLLYFADRLQTKKIILLCIILLPLFSMVNWMSLVLNIIPDAGLFVELEERYSGYAESEKQVTAHYIIIALALFLYCIMSWRKRLSVDVPTNIALLYLLILFANISMFAAFKRFSLFAYFPFVILTISNMLENWSAKVRLLTMFVCVIMLISTFRYTKGRLVGHYSSSYMDNSITEIVFSTANDYLSKHYDQ